MNAIKRVLILFYKQRGVFGGFWQDHSCSLEDNSGKSMRMDWRRGRFEDRKWQVTGSGSAQMRKDEDLTSGTSPGNAKKVKDIFKCS